MFDGLRLLCNCQCRMRYSAIRDVRSHCRTRLRHGCVDRSSIITLQPDRICLPGSRIEMEVDMFDQPVTSIRQFLETALPFRLAARLNSIPATPD
jgi:hypothetical protein